MPAVRQGNFVQRRDTMPGTYFTGIHPIIALVRRMSRLGASLSLSPSPANAEEATVQPAARRAITPVDVDRIMGVAPLDDIAPMVHGRRVIVSHGRLFRH